MSKSRRTPRPRGERDENARDLRKLGLFLEDTSGFRLGLATYDTPRTRQTQLDLVSEAVASRSVHLTLLDLSRTPNETQLLRRLQEHLHEDPAPAGKHTAVMVVGLEATLDYRKLEIKPTEGLAILYNANIQRDAYPRLCPVPVVIWLNPTATTTFAHAAPDLWHWRSASFRFTGPPDERQQMERTQIAMPLIESDRLPSGRKRERIALLRDLLVELENAEDPDSFGSKARRAALWKELGLMYDGLSEPNTAIEHFENALSLYREIGDRWGEGAALGDLGNAYADLGQVEKAIGYHEQALAIDREIGDRQAEGQDLGNLGLDYADLGQVEKAIGYYEQALAIDREIGDRRGESNVLGNLGVAYAALGQVEKAVGHYEQALVIDREIGDRRGEGTDLGNLGLAYADLGQVEKAIGCYEQHLVIAREIGDRRGESNALGNLGLAYAALGQVEKAIGYLERALQIGQEIKDPRINRFATALLERLRGDGND